MESPVRGAQRSLNQDRKRTEKEDAKEYYMHDAHKQRAKGRRENGRTECLGRGDTECLGRGDISGGSKGNKRNGKKGIGERAIEPLIWCWQTMSYWSD